MDILTYINRMNQIYGNGPAPAPRYNTQQYLQGGRVGYQGGQLVQPGPGRQGYNGVPRGTGTPEQVAIYAKTTIAKKRLEAREKDLVWDPKTQSMREAKKGGAPLGVESSKKGSVLTTPSKQQLEISEKVYSKKFNDKKGLELWKAMGKHKRSSVISKATTGETGGWKIPVPEGKIEQKELIKMLGEEYNQKMRRSTFSETVKGKKNYLVNKVADLLNRTEVPTKGKKVAYVFDKPTADQLDFIRNYIDSPHLMDRTVKNMRILDKEFGKILSKAADTEIGKKFFRETFTVEMAKEVLTKAGVKDISDAKVARAMTRLGQSYQGKLFKNEIGIGENKKTGEFIINAFNELDQYHPWRQASYNAALDDLKIAVGSKAGNITGFKQTFKELMQKRYENRKFVFNEVFSISTSANRGSYPYAYFVDLTEHDMNKGALSTFQGQGSIAEGKMQEAIKKYRRTGDIKHYNEAVRVKNTFNDSTRKLFLSSEKVLKYQKDYGIKPNALQLELGTAGQIKDRINFASNYYTTQHLKKWKDLGIDIDAHTGKSGYVKTFGKKDFVPKNVAVASELFTPETRFLKGIKKKVFDEKALNKFLESNKTLIEELGCGKATGGRVGFADGKNCLKKGREKMEKLLINGTGTQAEKGLISKIIQGAGTLLSPKELIRPVNLFGPAALAIYAGIEAGIISNDVINKGTPIKEALGANWMTKWAMPKTLMEYQIADLKKTGKLDSPLLKNFAQTTEQMAELDRLYNVLESNKAIGMSTADTETQIKELQDEITSTMKKNNMTLASFEPGSAAMIEFQNKLTEKEAKQLASTKESNVSDLMRTGTLDMGNLKDPYKPMFGFDELKPKENIFRVDPKKGRMSTTRTVKDYTLPTYKNMTEEPVTKEERVYQQKRYGLKPEQRIEDYTDAETGVNLAKALELKKKWTQALNQPGMMGTSEKFKLGGKVEYDDSLPDIFEEDK